MHLSDIKSCTSQMYVKCRFDLIQLFKYLLDKINKLIFWQNWYFQHDIILFRPFQTIKMWNQIVKNI